MSTNFYWHEKQACKTCGHQDDGLHIGKRSGGWTFSLAAHEEPRLMSWRDWKGHLRTAGGEIRDEYSRAWDVEEFIAMVEDWQKGEDKSGPFWRHAIQHPSPNDWLDEDGYSLSMRPFS